MTESYLQFIGMPDWFLYVGKYGFQLFSYLALSTYERNFNCIEHNLAFLQESFVSNLKYEVYIYF